MTTHPVSRGASGSSFLPQPLEASVPEPFTPYWTGSSTTRPTSHVGQAHAPFGGPDHSSHEDCEDMGCARDCSQMCSRDHPRRPATNWAAVPGQIHVTSTSVRSRYKLADFGTSRRSRNATGQQPRTAKGLASLSAGGRQLACPN